MSNRINNVLVIGSGNVLPVAIGSLLESAGIRHKLYGLKNFAVERVSNIRSHDALIITALKVSNQDVTEIIQLSRNFADLPVLIVTLEISEEQMISLIRGGVRGLITEDAEIPLIPKAVQALHRGELWCPRNLFSIVLQSFKEGEGGAPTLARKTDISPRELEILEEMARGKTNKQIAEDLGISYSTVVNHSNNIFKKLDVNNRTSAVRVATEQNILEL
jgi:DNA-binding NarL/FixJ family response regulator